MTTILLVQLPIDILVNIFKNLNIQDLHNLILTCKILKQLIVNENAIWRSICRTRLIIHDQGKNSKLNRSWYNQCRVSQNWCKGIYKSKGLIYHHINYMPWLKFQPEALLLTIGSEIVCYPVDRYGFPNCNNILWKLNMPEIYRYDVRTNDISKFILKGDLLVCGNRSGSTAVYKVDNIKLKPHLMKYIKDCHENGQVEVSAVEIINNGENSFMVTASSNSPLVLFWNWGTQNDVTNLSNEGHDIGNCMGIDLDDYEGAKSLAINERGDKLAIGPNGNSKPILIDVNTGEFLMNPEDSKNVNQAVRDIQWHNENTICYVTHSGLLQMIDIRSHKVIYNTKDPFQSSLYCVKTDGHNAIIAGSSEYSRCVLFDSRYPHHAQLYFTQRKSSPVYSLDFDSTKLIAAVDRGVTALNFNISATSTQQRDYSHIFHT